MSAGKLDELFRKWLALRGADILPLKGDDEDAKEAEAERISDEMIVVERAILAGEAETEDDSRAQVAILAYYAVHMPPYPNYEVVEQWCRRLVVERLPDASLRIREREWSRKRVDYARERLSERDEP
jgi:hypothetical protein